MRRGLAAKLTLQSARAAGTEWLFLRHETKKNSTEIRLATYYPALSRQKYVLRGGP